MGSTAVVAGDAPVALLKVLNGVHAGKELPVTKTLITVGLPGQLVAAITLQGGSFFITRIIGAESVTLNGQAVGDQSIRLAFGDVISLSGTQVEFSRF